ncbi:MAG TPA: hypothetical protein VGW38_23825 [Chloroflexota bacterium]|nr:hypothetical protein [Chloroflexota bacterium]
MLRELTAGELQQEARRALEGRTQAEAAQALNVTPSAISLALNTETPRRYAATLIRIIEHFTPSRVEAVTLYRLREEERLNDQ